MTSALFYEDIEPGMTFSTAARTIVEDDLLTFAKVSGDRHPIHVDAEYAAQTEFGQRIAHGPFGVAMAIGLFGTLPQFSKTGTLMLDIDGWKLRAPIFVGDRIHLGLTLTEKRLTRSGRGIVGRHFQLIRHDGTVPQEGYSAMVVLRRSEI